MTREEQEREQLLMEKNRQCKWDDHMRSEDRLKVEELKKENKRYGQTITISARPK